MNLENIEKIELKSISEIKHRLTRLSSENTGENIIRISELIEDIATFLIVIDSETKNLRGNNEMMQVFKNLIFPLLEINYVTFREDLISIGSQSCHPYIFLFPKEDTESIEKVIIASKRRDYAAGEPISVSNLFIHSHTDTVTYESPYGMNEPFVRRAENPLENILFGRGIIDMKGQIATLVVTLYLLHDLRQKPPLILLTSDEEMGSKASKALLKNISTELAIDLEPSLPDHYSSKITTTQFIFFSLLEKPNKEDVLLEEIRDFINHTYPLDKYDIKVNFHGNDLLISIIDKLTYKLPPLEDEFLDSLQKFVNQLIPYDYYVDIPTIDFNSHIEPKIKQNLETVFRRRSAKPIERFNRSLTDNIPLVDSRDSIINHNFNTALTFHLRSSTKGLVITGPRAIGERHSNIEAGLMDDFVIIAKNLVELVSGKEIFPEA